MAIFQFKDGSLVFHTQVGPFGSDTVLLHPSDREAQLWQPLLDEWAEQPAGGGRVWTCEWSRAASTVSGRAETLVRWVQTMGAHQLHVIAVGDAVPVVEEARRLDAQLFNKVLSLPQMPTDLKSAVRAFVPALS